MATPAMPATSTPATSRTPGLPAVTPSADTPRPLPEPISLSAALDRLPSIGLAGLTERAELLTRTDRKYLVDLGDLPGVVGALADGESPVAVLEIDGRRDFGYESVYFDTPALTSYLQAARRRPRRFKVRTRTYLDSEASFLEVKTRDGRRRTVKTRMDRPSGQDRWEPLLDPSAQGFVAGLLDRSVPDGAAVVSTLTPTLATRYRRTTLHLPGDAARVTLDVQLRATDRHGAALVVPGLAIVETKTLGRACAADRVLWQRGLRPIKVSKYATAMAALHARLPAAKWRPALRRMGAVPTRS